VEAAPQLFHKRFGGRGSEGFVERQSDLLGAIFGVFPFVHSLKTIHVLLSSSITLDIYSFL